MVYRCGGQERDKVGKNGSMVVREEGSLGRRVTLVRRGVGVMYSEKGTVNMRIIMVSRELGQALSAGGYVL